MIIIHVAEGAAVNNEIRRLEAAFSQGHRTNFTKRHRQLGGGVKVTSNLLLVVQI